jgi:4-amino-4-deoxy-L-arabinose transferase-like glycosyltransferase
MWLPLFAALVILLTAPPAPGPEGDATIYRRQANAISRLDMPSDMYPPGLPLVLATGHAVGLGPHAVVKLISMVLVLLVVVAARRLGGPPAGAVAGVLCCLSPWVLASGRYVMSDPLGAVFCVLGLLAVLARRPRWAIAATVFGVLVRMFSGVGVLALAVHGRRVLTAGAIATVVVIGGYQWVAYGGPQRHGYESSEPFWKISFVADGNRILDEPWFVDGTAARTSTQSIPARNSPNLVAYPLVVLGVTYVFLPPFLSVIGMWALWVRRRTEPARFVALWFAGSLALALPYYYRAPRFLAPAMMLLVVYTAVGICDLVSASKSDHTGEPALAGG